ncbi:ECF transporter S component [bacterium]|nr:ECF transporter S component [bacterium]
MGFSREEITAIGIFAGLACAGGYLLMAVPNVEVFTATIFLSGVLLGPRNGAVVGIIAATIYAIFNPFGISPAPLFVAQVVSRALTGWVGGLVANVLNLRQVSWPNALWLGLIGIVLTLFYDFLAELSFYIVSGFSIQQILVKILAGLHFVLLHGLGNTTIFSLVLPFVIKGLMKAQILKTARVS